MNAWESANTKEMEKILNKGFDINKILTEEEPTYLIKAILAKNVDMVRFLLENGANPNLIPFGNNAFFYTGSKVKEDIQILELLVEYKTFFLPCWPTKEIIVDILENLQYAVEDEIDQLEQMYNSYRNNNNNDRNAYNYTYRGGARTMEELDTEFKIISEAISLLRPLQEKYVKKLQINFFGQNRVETIEIDERAEVKILQELIINFFLRGEGTFSFDLMMPSFRMKNKSVMNMGRALSDYGIRNETRLILTPRLSSQRHGGGGRRKTRRILRKKE